ncbi:Rpp14/Pop5 family-domain-containing protein [Trichophaea hybrida]|nr:Rpp14/Pop5 family-domain-containing protein [Trichophaea hybrida]
MVRYKSRYLLFKILYPITSSPSPAHISFHAPSPPSTTPSELATLLRQILSQQFGDWGSGVAGGLSVKYFSPATSTGIVRVSREQYRLVWAALTYVREIKGRPCVVRVVRVSGTIKKAELEVVRRGRWGIRMVGEEEEKRGLRGEEGEDVVMEEDGEGE